MKPHPTLVKTVCALLAMTCLVQTGLALDKHFSATAQNETTFVGSNDPQNVVAIAMNPRNTKILYATTLYKGVFKTTDGGHSWKPTVLAGSQYGLFKSDDAGA